MKASKLRKGVSALALSGGLLAVLVLAPGAMEGSAGGEKLALAAGENHPQVRMAVFWESVQQREFPGLGAVMAGTLLLAPFGLSTLRLWRQGGRT